MIFFHASSTQDYLYLNPKYTLYHFVEILIYSCVFDTILLARQMLFECHLAPIYDVARIGLGYPSGTVIDCLRLIPGRPGLGYLPISSSSVLVKPVCSTYPDDYLNY